MTGAHHGAASAQPVTASPSFADAWPAATARTPLCVGLDPHPETLVAWGLTDTDNGAEQFSYRILEALAGTEVGIIKPQSALYERYGARGIAVLERVVAKARAAGLQVVLDAKRGDIGSTMAGYAQAYLGPKAPLASDALTVSPYLGMDALAPAFDVAREAGTGLFVLALTSNPHAERFQHARTASGLTVAGEVVARVAEENEKSGAPQFGLVVGATIGAAGVAAAGVDLAGFNGPILSPGVGAQGAGTGELDAVFGSSWTQGRVVVCVARGIASAGPAVDDLRSEIWKYVHLLA